MTTRNWPVACWDEFSQSERWDDKFLGGPWVSLTLLGFKILPKTFYLYSSSLIGSFKEEATNLCF